MIFVFCFYVCVPKKVSLSLQLEFMDGVNDHVGTRNWTKVVSKENK